METPDEIWTGDLFARREEAENLIGYLENVAARPKLREDGHAHVLAVDSNYGRGKTYFLRRLNRHLQATEHVSAFVDAWVDDLEDEPLVALAATLEAALSPWIQKEPLVKERYNEFKTKAGRVAKIVGVGLAKRGLGFVITQSGAEALGEEFSSLSDEAKENFRSVADDTVKEIIDDSSDVIGVDALKMMDERIRRFQAGQRAIYEMRQSLTMVVNSLQDAGMKLPIVIIIDELDRCRPTYAIKVLEEVKHLFDVSGVAFILGLHCQQLAHSVSAAYGSSFNGPAYLRRFFSRRYILREALLAPLLEQLSRDLDIPLQRLAIPKVKMKVPNSHATNLSAINFIADVLSAYGMTARDAFSVMELLQTCLALTAPHNLSASYILPLIVAHVTSSTTIPQVEKEPTWAIAKYASDSNDRSSGRWIERNLQDSVLEMEQAVLLTKDDLIRRYNDNFTSPAILDIAEARLSIPNDSLANPQNYRRLMETVSRFKSD